MRNLVTRGKLPLLSSVAAIAIVGGAACLDASTAPASAQTETRVSTSIDFHAVLQPYGRWQHHQRWGEVWLPASRPRDWRPYTHGHWGYTEEWGWYWISAQDEQDWGWVAFHYGRWVFDPEMGWIWIPRHEWAPAWVDWRRGGRHIGWAPLPPEEILVEIEPRPDVWIFVRDRDFIAPRISEVVLERREYDVFIRETVVVNRTIIEERQRIAINPGIEPTFIAAAVGRPLRPVEVRPPVLAGTVGVQNAIEVRTTERQSVRETVIEKQQAAIQPARNVPPPTPLRPGEKGRLGENPPAAARQAQQPGQPSAGPGTVGQERQPGAPAETRREPPGRPGAPGTAQQPPRPGTPGTAQQPPRPGAPSTAQQPQQPGKPSAAEERKQPGMPEERQRRGAERQPGAAPERRGETPKPQGREIGREQPGAAQGATPPPRPEQRGEAAKPQGREGSRTEQRRGPPGAEPQRGRAEERRGPRATEQRVRPEQRLGPSSAEQRGGRGPGAEERRGPSAATREQRPSPQQGRAQERGGTGMAQEPRGGGRGPGAAPEQKGPRGPNPAERRE